MLPQLNGSFRHENLQENSVYVSGEQDGVFNSNDFVLFYAVGPDDWETSSESNITHRKNRYSDQAFYFISVDNGIGKRISTAPVIETVATDQISSFKDFVFYEKDLTNLFGSGQQWFGDSFQIKNTRNYSIDFQNLDTSSEVLFRVRAVAESSSTSSMNVQIDGLSSFDINFNSIIMALLCKSLSSNQRIFDELNRWGYRLGNFLQQQRKSLSRCAFGLY